jgi:hypothetical protein
LERATQSSLVRVGNPPRQGGSNDGLPPLENSDILLPFTKVAVTHMARRVALIAVGAQVKEILRRTRLYRVYQRQRVLGGEVTRFANWTEADEQRLAFYREEEFIRPRRLRVRCRG